MRTLTCAPLDVESSVRALGVETQIDFRVVSVVPLTYVLHEQWNGRPEMPPTHYRCDSVLVVLESS